jgi:hypothetical protein
VVSSASGAGESGTVPPDCVRWGLGWTGATVESARSDVYWVTDPATGHRAEITVAQPVRSGEGGIWAVVQAGSVALG